MIRAILGSYVAGAMYLLLGQLGLFKITAESSVAAGVRRIEAITAGKAEAYVNKHLEVLSQIEGAFKNPTNVLQQIQSLIDENRQLQKKISKLQDIEVAQLKTKLKDKVKEVDNINYLAEKVDGIDAQALKSLAYQLEKEVGNAFIVFASEINQKPQLMVTISDQLTKDRGLHAGNIVRELAKEIKGGGGGQPFFATAGGKGCFGY